MTRGVLTALMLWLWVSAAMAQAQPEEAVVRPVESAYTVSVGAGRLLDTYLSPVKYNGVALSLGYERGQAMRFDPERWTMRLGVAVQGVLGQNPSGNADMQALQLRLRWGMTRRWRVGHGMELAAGGCTTLDGGCLYNSRNGNNPASAKAAWTLDATGHAAWLTRIGRLPVSVIYRPTVSVIGAFFAPAYGELYYEIYLGNRKGLAHCAWWGNYVATDHLLAADLRFGATWLRIGFSGSVMSTKINNINTRIAQCCAVVGIAGNWVSLDGRKPLSENTKMITATY